MHSPCAALVTFHYLGSRPKAINHHPAHTISLMKDLNQLTITELKDRLALVESVAKTGFWRIELNSGALFWDERMFELYDLSKDEFTGTIESWKKVVHPDDLERALGQFQEAIKAEGQFEFTFRVVHKNGSIHHIKAIAIYQENNGNPQMIGVNVDYTKEVEIGREALRAAQLYKTLIEQNPNPTAMFDANMRYIAVSKRWVEAYGLEGKELIGKSHYEIFPEISDEWKAIHSEALNGKGMSREVDPFVRADGTTQYIRWDLQPWYTHEGETGGIIMFTEDITDRILEEIKNREISEYFADTKKLARIGTWEVDFVTGKSFWDDVVADIYKTPHGWYPDDPADGIAFYKEGESREKIAQAFQELIENGTTYDIQVQLVNTAGEEIWVRSLGNPVYDKNGKLIKATGLFQDIDKEKRAELEKDVHLRQLELMSERLSMQNHSLMDFAHITSHNLRAPVGNLVSLSKLYQEFDPAERETIFENIHNEITRLSETLDDLIEALVIRESVGLNVEQISLNALLEKLSKSLSQTIADNDFVIESDFSAIESIESNKTYVESIFLNLISNAIKYRNPEANPSYLKITSSKMGQNIRITFEDNGLGIDLEQNKHKVFTLYKTFHRNPDSKGVGLFMVKTHVEALSGTIQIESMLHKGTTFTIQLPISNHID